MFRAFGLYEENVQVDPEREHIEKAVLQEYKQKLNIHGNIIPDPIDLKSGWINEKNGMKKWPRLYFSDISRFYSFVLGKDNLIHRLECEYKQGRAYRYFTNSFIGETLYHNIDEKSKFCLLKTKFAPSQRLNMKQYDVWVVCRKDLIDSIGREILSAYCTCTAGLYGSCNHVVGLLFRVEAAVLIGLSNPTCTSVSAAWNIPSAKKQIIPDEISKFIFTNDTYMKKATKESEEARKERAEAKQNFRVTTNSQYEALQNHKNVRNDLFQDVHT